MKLKDVFAALENVENGTDMIACIKSELADLRQEAAAHREAKEEADARVKALEQEVEESTERTQAEGDARVRKLEKEVENMKKQYEEAEKARQEAIQQRIEADMNAQAVDALTKHHAIDPKLCAELLVKHVVVNEDGTYSMRQGDTLVGLEEGAKSWLESHAWAVRNTQKAGSGEGRLVSVSVAQDGPKSLVDALADAYSR